MFWLESVWYACSMLCAMCPACHHVAASKCAHRVAPMRAPSKYVFDMQVWVFCESISEPFVRTQWAAGTDNASPRLCSHLHQPEKRG